MIANPTTNSLTTALYPSHSPFLGTDPVFATKKSLICDLSEEKDAKKWGEMGWEAGEVGRRCREAQTQAQVGTQVSSRTHMAAVGNRVLI